MHVRSVDTRIEAEAVGDLGIRGMTQDEFAATYDDRDVGFRHAEAIEDHLHVRFRVQVDVRKRVDVACQEFLYA